MNKNSCNKGNCNLSSSLEQQIRYICENEYDFFLNKPNVQAIALGFNVVNKLCTFQKYIKVFLSKKLSENSLPLNALVPPIYKGIITDTIESGTFSSSQLTSKVRPVFEGLGRTTGAILFDEYFNALGLLFITTDKKNFTSFNLISDVLKLLNLSLITSN